MSVRNRDVLFSFFMFTTDLQPGDPEYARRIVAHMKELCDIGYDGFDLPIAPSATSEHRNEVERYERLRQALDNAGLKDVRVTTNVFATRTFDPSSPYKEQREIALGYLKSRVEITKALRGDVMAGPVVLPYGVFPTTDNNTPIWSDSLQDWLVARYRNAMPVLEALAEYAARQGVKVAIEPVGHWETTAPNLVSDLLRFLEGVQNAQVGACPDSAQVVLGSDNLDVHTSGMKQLIEAGRLHYVHLSAPDRGALKDSWIPWRPFLEPVFERFEGPYLVEVFNAIPVFLSSLRITRRKFWIPGEDNRVPNIPDAYTVAREALEEVRRQFDAFGGAD
jgi:sugar phosphate isomerase/epimerase